MYVLLNLFRKIYIQCKLPLVIIRMLFLVKLMKSFSFMACRHLITYISNGQFQKISIPNHGRLSCFNPPLPSEIPECVTSPCPQNSIIMNPPYPLEFPGFFWRYIFDLAMFIWTNKHEFMPPKGCDLAAPSDKLYFQRQEKPTDRMWPGCATLFLSVNLAIKKHQSQ